MVGFVCVKKKTGILIICEAVEYKSQELAKSHSYTQNQFKANMSWCVYMIGRNRFSLCRRTWLVQKLPADFEEKLVAFRWYVIGL
jgi:hypothetical protein